MVGRSSFWDRPYARRRGFQGVAVIQNQLLLIASLRAERTRQLASNTRSRSPAIVPRTSKMQVQNGRPFRARTSTSLHRDWLTRDTVKPCAKGSLACRGPHRDGRRETAGTSGISWRSTCSMWTSDNVGVRLSKDARELEWAYRLVDQCVTRPMPRRVRERSNGNRAGRRPRGSDQLWNRGKNYASRSS